MKGFSRRTLAIAIVAAAWFVPQAAFAEAPVRVSLTARHVSVANGKEVLAAADKARPGDVLEYRATYRNEGRSAVREVQAILPLPEGVEYVPGSATPAGVTASLDGRTFGRLPLVRRTVGPDGRAVVREVPVSQYRYLRWPLGAMDGGGVRTVVARARITPLQAAALER
jgi:uncharacterized repeat protein (TIGR01451 family)